MDVSAGDTLRITASGMTMGNNTGVTADGAPRGWVDTLRALMVPSAGRGALVGRIGDSEAATPFLVGANGKILAPTAGRLYLGINHDTTQSPVGSFQVHIERTPAAVAATPSNYDFRNLFAVDRRLPYRVSDRPGGGNPGDLVNFVLVGSASQVTEALKAAGWIQADRPTKKPCRRVARRPDQKFVYGCAAERVYLFGRSQDYGYERTDRLWSRPSAIIYASGRRRGPRRSRRFGPAPALTMSASSAISALPMKSRIASIRMWTMSATSSAQPCNRLDRWRPCRT